MRKPSLFFPILHYTSLATAHYFPACSVLFLSYDISIYFFIYPVFLYATYLLLVFIGILLLTYNRPTLLMGSVV
jgi:hypothetical protein